MSKKEWRIGPRNKLVGEGLDHLLYIIYTAAINIPGFPSNMLNVKVGDRIEIKRVITVEEINDKEKQIKIKWKDKLGNEKVQWVTYNMFYML